MRVLELAKKDLKLEFRTKSSLSLMLLFSLTSAFLFSAAISDPEEIFSSLLLLIFLLTGILGYSTSFLKEFDSETIEGLKASPLTPQQIVAGKIVFNIILMFTVQSIIFPVCYALFDVSGNFGLSFIVFTACNASIAVAITALSPLLSQSRSREMLLPVVLFPIVFPLISSTVSLVNLALSGNIELSQILFVFAYTGIITSISMLTADKIL
ncbi:MULTISPECIES: heme exporter protein CcmB [unclassified Archaeoglobus]|jgi:heme exporter protein B|uniref:heme exporter protein CcmB n=1 Tax=unclassified Archaeoglobus TaxID=2643606 RepID=UPI0025BC7CF1|nr:MULTISPECIES: heme exporter protein CcmB [unclassified Archaeoglobus]